MNSRRTYLSERSQKNKDVHRPVFFRLANSGDRDKFETLIESTDVFLYDELYGQIRELIKSRSPGAKYAAADYETLIEKHLSGTPMSDYGVWVYYPWSARLVHLLDEAEFIELRTAANRNKITTKERDLLATKKVGVIGLSVGQSVSITLALERGCGELRLADFDTIELNNLNRINTGVHNLGMLKAYSIARDIAEIDPFFKVVCYPKGIDEDNIHDFMTGDGKLDLVMDECDGINIKILCRVVAKQYQIPVLMEASDKGTIDVERFDLEPDRPILHGWLEHLPIDFNVLKNLKTNEEKLPYILPISGLDTLSPRMKASMVEIEQSLTTWPQLASAVMLGGAISADTTRRIFLGQYTASDRYFIDLERLIPDMRPLKEYTPPEGPAPLTSEEMNAMADKTLAVLPPVADPAEVSNLHELVRAAIAAPTAGNNQPWKWLYKQNVLFLFHDRHRSVSFGDYKGRASHMGLGAALENLELQAHQQHTGTILHPFPLSGSEILIAAIQFCTQANKYLYEPEQLSAHIYERQTNRRLGERKTIAPEVYAQLREAVSSIAGADLLLIDSPEQLNELAGIMGGADRLRLLHPDGHYEFYNKELRWSDEQSRVTGDGIDLSTVDVTPSEIVGLKLVKDPRVAELLASWGGGKGLERLAHKSIAAASAVGLVITPSASPIDCLMGGRAIQRMWLWATKLGISLQPMEAATLHFARLLHGNGEGMPEFMKQEFGVLFEKFQKIFPQLKEKEGLFLFRLSVAEKPVTRSYRLPVEKVLTVVQ